jgi:hypothetical protein
MKLIRICALLLVFSAAALASEPQPLQQVLARSGTAVSKFLDQFARVTCTESVLQEKLRPNGKLEYRESSTFELLVMLNAAGGELMIDESRTPKGRPRAPKNLRLLVTNGFSTLLLVFHPHYQGSFEFTQLQDEVIAGRRALKVQFEHIRGTPTPTALLLRGREYPVDLSGTAWIDYESGAVMRIRAGLGSSMEDIGLRAFHSDVEYASIALPGHNYWLPVSAVIDVQTPRQHWRNIHHFSQYKRFSVSTIITVPES